MFSLFYRHFKPPLTDVGAAAFGNSFPIHTLDLSGNQITDVGAISLAKGIIISSDISASHFSLSLKNNKIGNEGAIALIKSVKSLQHRQFSIDLSDQKPIIVEEEKFHKTILEDPIEEIVLNDSTIILQDNEKADIRTSSNLTTAIALLEEGKTDDSPVSTTVEEESLGYIDQQALQSSATAVAVVVPSELVGVHTITKSIYYGNIACDELQISCQTVITGNIIANRILIDAEIFPSFSFDRNVTEGETSFFGDGHTITILGSLDCSYVHVESFL